MSGGQAKKKLARQQLNYVPLTESFLFSLPHFFNTPSDLLPHLTKLSAWNKQTQHHDLNQG